MLRRVESRGLAHNSYFLADGGEAASQLASSRESGSKKSTMSSAAWKLGKSWDTPKETTRL